MQLFCPIPLLLDIAPGGVAVMVALGLLPWILIADVVIIAVAVLIRALRKQKKASAVHVPDPAEHAEPAAEAKTEE